MYQTQYDCDNYGLCVKCDYRADIDTCQGGMTFVDSWGDYDKSYRTKDIIHVEDSADIEGNAYE